MLKCPAASNSFCIESDKRDFERSSSTLSPCRTILIRSPFLMTCGTILEEEVVVVVVVVLTVAFRFGRFVFRVGWTVDTAAGADNGEEGVRVVLLKLWLPTSTSFELIVRVESQTSNELGLLL